MIEYKKALFKDGDFELEITISPEEKTIWMAQKQMELLFKKHIRLLQVILNMY